MCVLWYFQLDNGDPQGQYIQDEEPSLTNCISWHCQNRRIPQMSIELKLLWRAVLTWTSSPCSSLQICHPAFNSYTFHTPFHFIKYFIFRLFICCLFLHTHCTALVVPHSDFLPGQPGKGITYISYYASLRSTLIALLWLFTIQLICVAFQGSLASSWEVVLIRLFA